MVGTDPSGKGGIATVIRQYREAGLFEGDAIRFVASHHDRGPLGRFLPFLFCALRLWGACMSGKVALLHAHASYAGSFWRKLILAIPLFLVGIPVLVHLHAGDYMDFYNRGGRWRRFWIRFLLRHANCVITLSDEWRTWAIAVEPSANAVVLFNSLSGETGRSGQVSASDVPVALFLGRIGERKGAFDLLEAFVEVRRRVGNAKLVFGGDGEAEALRERAGALGLGDAVDVAGWVAGAEKQRMLSACWLFVLPSYHEGLPMAILEAMAHSRAVVSTPVGGIPQAVIEGETGFLVPAGAVNDLADRLVAILSSRAVAERMGLAGRRMFDKKFSSEANLPLLLDLYRRAGAETLPVLRPGGQESPSPTH